MGKDYVVKKQNTNSGAKKAAFLSNLKFFGMSLISNDTCVEARKKPWYAAIIIAFLSTIIAMSPVIYNYFTTSGGSFMNSPVYNMDNALVDFDAALSGANLSCKIQDSKLTIDSSAWKSAFPDTTTLGQKNPDHAYVHDHIRLVCYDKTDLTKVVSLLDIRADKASRFDIVLLPELVDMNQTEPDE